MLPYANSQKYARVQCSRVSRRRVAAVASGRGGCVMIGIGPFSIQVVTVIAAVLLAWLTARIVGRRTPGVAYKVAGSMILDAVFWGLLAARLAYIAQWWEEYSVVPKSMIAIGEDRKSTRLNSSH